MRTFTESVVPKQKVFDRTRSTQKAETRQLWYASLMGRRLTSDEAATNSHATARGDDSVERG